MTTREKIDNLLNNCSEKYLDSIWGSLLNYHNLSELNDYGYSLGDVRYKLYAGVTNIVPITEILHNGEQIMFLNELDGTFEKDIKWDKLFLTRDDAKNHAIQTISDILTNLEQTLDEDQ